MAVSPPLIGSLEPMDTINYLEDIPTDTLIGVPRGDMDIEGLKNRLQEIYIENMELETRKSLLQTLVNENLATRDIYSFIKN